jgi:hypothetical protein
MDARDDDNNINSRGSLPKMVVSNRSGDVLHSLVSELSFWDMHNPAESSKDDRPQDLQVSTNASSFHSVNYMQSDPLNQSLIHRTISTESDASSVVQKMASKAAKWKMATDPASGRPYYYDTATRVTQWEKVRTC